MHFHGTDDKFLPFNGGIGDRSLARMVFRSVDDSIQAWVKADGCPAKPIVAEIAAKSGDSTSVERKTYGPGKEGPKSFCTSSTAAVIPGRAETREQGFSANRRRAYRPTS